MLNIAKLLPSEAKFHQLIGALAHQAEASARLLKTLVDTDNAAKRREAFQAIETCKIEAKRLSNDITRELCLTFVTPFDREDIQAFAAHLYKIPKTVEKLRNLVDTYGITDLKDLHEQVDLIMQESDAMSAMVQALIKGNNTDEILRKAALLDALESRGDEVLNRLLANLMRDTPDARQLIIRKDLYDMLERIIDRYRDAAGVALQIVLKNS